METSHNQIVSFIWSIADDVLRDVFLRGQYRDVILPMVVLRRLDALLEPTKEEVEQEIKESGFIMLIHKMLLLIQNLRQTILSNLDLRLKILYLRHLVQTMLSRQMLAY